MHSICRIAALLTALILIPAAHASGATIYKWVDDEGVTHYAQQPPSNRDAQLITPNTVTGPQQDSAQSSDATKRNDSSTEEKTGDQGPQNMAEFCEQVRERIATLESDEPVSVRQPDDSLERLSDEERARRLEQGRRQLQQHCTSNNGG